RLNLFLMLVLCSYQSAYAELMNRLLLTHETFLSPDYRATTKRDFDFIGASLRSPPPQDIGTYFDVKGAYAVGVPVASYLNVAELYQVTHDREHVKVSFGRRRHLWSFVDQDWNLGIFQPNFRWNPLEPIQQGLTGFFYQKDHENLSYTLFASFLYLPDQGPSFEINDRGEFVEGSPWFRRPPQSYVLRDEKGTVVYDIRRPVESSIVFRQSLGAQLQIQKDAWLGRLSFAAKPMNQLALLYNSVLDTSLSKTASVSVEPRVTNHQVAAADLQWQRRNWTLTASWVEDRPSSKIDLPEGWAGPVYSPAAVFGLGVRHARKNFILGLHRLEIFGGEVREAGNTVSGELSLSEKYPLREAYRLSGEYFSRHWSVGASFLDSVRHRMQIVGLNGLIRLNQRWRVGASAQLVKASLMGERAQLTQYADHDRVAVGVLHDF
ncbi:MAG: hypothetical protein N2578_05160, partial [Bdellovibrionaceae bacterium]|nr:hypothetical protein [Pseudobdellovibrionaceae bacterium]